MKVADITSDLVEENAASPIQLQLATDEEFVTASRSHMESDQARQVFLNLFLTVSQTLSYLI